MRTLTATLTGAQKVGGNRLSKIVLTFSPSAWAASTAYTEGERVEPTSANTYVYQCTASGTSDSSEPTWTTTVGGTVTDNTVTWTNIGLKSQTYTKKRGANTGLIAIDPHIEAVDTQSATVLLDNSDQAFTSRDLRGFQCVISYGYTTSGGDEYSACATLWVISQNDHSLKSGKLVTTLELIGIPDLLAQDKANDDYEPDTTNTNTVKTIVTAVLGATLACFDHCQAYTTGGGGLTIDWEDALFDSFQPKDSFRVQFGESRLDVLNRLLSWTRMVKRFEAGAEIHLFSPMRIEDKETWQANHAYEFDDVVEPTTPNGYLYTPETEGTSHAATEPTWPTGIGDTVSDGTITWIVAYHYDYSLASDYHDFFDKATRERIVIPGYVSVESYPGADSAAQYSGTAQDDAYDSYPAQLKIRDYRRLRVASNAEAANVATALLRHNQTQAEKGSALVPMNVGQEVYDFVYLIDARSGDNRSGLIQYIKRRDTTEFEMEFSFAPFTHKPAMDIRPGSSLEPARVSPEHISAIWDYIEDMTMIIDERLDGHGRLIQSLWETVYFGAKTVYIQVIDKDTALTTGDSKYLWTVPPEYNGYLVIEADAAVDTASTSGTPTFQIHNLTDVQDILSTLITIDENEKNSYFAATQPVINTSYDDLATGDIIRIDCDVAGTGTKGLAIRLGLRRP